MFEISVKLFATSLLINAALPELIAICWKLACKRFPSSTDVPKFLAISNAFWSNWITASINLKKAGIIRPSKVVPIPVKRAVAPVAKTFILLPPSSAVFFIFARISSALINWPTIGILDKLFNTPPIPPISLSNFASLVNCFCNASSCLFNCSNNTICWSTIAWFKINPSLSASSSRSWISLLLPSTALICSCTLTWEVKLFPIPFSVSAKILVNLTLSLISLFKSSPILFTIFAWDESHSSSISACTLISDFNSLSTPLRVFLIFEYTSSSSSAFLRSLSLGPEPPPFGGSAI